MSDPAWRIDGFEGIRRGVNSGLDPDQVPRDQLSWAVNTTMRRGKPKNRPGMARRALVFESVATQSAFEDGRWQGAGPYIWRGQSDQDVSILLCSIGGRIYEIDVSNYNVSDITIEGDANPSIQPKAWFEQGEMFTFIQDGQSLPLIYNAGGLRRAEAGTEIPVGTLMAYCLGRMTVALPDGRSFVAGNIVGSTEGGTEEFNYRDSIISFTENDYLNGGGVFSTPSRITAMRGIATIDTTLSQGPLQIFTALGAYSANYPFDRAEWFAMRYPLKTGSLLSRGALGQNSTININNDIWFRSSDGIRSLQIARRDSGSWGDTPMSQEMDRVLRHDTSTLLDNSSAVLFDNRMLMTAGPVYVPDRGVYHRGLMALDFFEASSLARDGSPAYDCLWTGLRILQILTIAVNNVPKCFIFALDPDDKIALYELSTSDPHDNYGLPTQQRIPWVVETPSYNWGENSPASKRYKKLESGNVWVSGLSGPVNFNVRYRADNYPVWKDWHNWSECAELVCAPVWCSTPNQLQYRPRMPLPLPQDVCESQTKKLTRFGWTFQARIEVTGPGQIDVLQLIAVNTSESKFQECRGEEECQTLQACDLAVFGYAVT